MKKKEYTSMKVESMNASIGKMAEPQQQKKQSTILAPFCYTGTCNTLLFNT